jgi:peroxiredoxin
MNAGRTPNIGDFAPNFELVDSTGTLQHLSEMVSHGPLILIFYRGHW